MAFLDVPYSQQVRLSRKGSLSIILFHHHAERGKTDIAIIETKISFLPYASKMVDTQ